MIGAKVIERKCRSWETQRYLIVTNYVLLFKNSKNKCPMLAKTIAIIKLCKVKISSTAHNNPLFLASPEWVYSPIKRFE
jgi:hypothetical protein